ncbi:MAG: hypothetical protein KIG16_01740 [Eubacteriales bacterium]|nr:hypothetical protein [Eubacteriales bacterium]
MEILRKLGLVSVIFLGLMGLVIDIGFVFFCYFNQNTTTDNFNINGQAPVDVKELKDSKNLSDDEINDLENRKLFEVNLYSNFDKSESGKRSGVVLEELKINHFIDSSLSADSIVSSGMQYISDYDGRKGLYLTSPTAVNKSILDTEYIQKNVNKLRNWENDNSVNLVEFSYFNKTTNRIYCPTSEKEFKSKNEADSYIPQEFNYYERAGLDGVNWNAMGLQTQLNRNTELIIRIGDDNNKAYKIKLDKYLDTTYDNTPKKFLEFFDVTRWFDKGGRIQYYNWDNVFEDIMHAVLTNHLQSGTHYAAVNLTKYFTVTEHYNTETEYWEPASGADQQILYAVIKYTYHTNGAVSKAQSLFNVINNDPRFDTRTVTYDTSFGQAEVVLNLTNDTLSKRYSDAYNGYLVSLSIDMQRKLNEMPPYIVNVNLDLDKKLDGKSIVGLDVNAFDGFELGQLSIEGSGDFYLLNNSLRNSNVELKVAKTVNVIDIKSGVVL